MDGLVPVWFLEQKLLPLRGLAGKRTAALE
jgi:hypothetical protein